MSNYKVNVPKLAKKPLPDEELLKLDIIELTRKPQFSVYTVFDEVLILIRKRRMDKSHQVLTVNESLNIIRLPENVILEVNPVKAN